MVDFAAARKRRMEEAEQAKLMAANNPPVVYRPPPEPTKTGRCRTDDIKNLVDLVADCEDKMTQWETDFCYSCAKWLDSKELAQLSAKQGATLDELVSKHL